MLQVIDDQSGEIRIVGALESPKQVSPTVWIEIRTYQPIERSIFETRKILVSLFGDLRESLAADESLIEFCRQIWFLANIFTLMIEFDS